MHFYFKGIKADTPRLYPYMATCPSDRKQREFESITDVHSELVRLYDEAVERKAAVGDALYMQHFFFTTDLNLIDLHKQSTIKGMRYCCQTGTAPFPSLYDTPADYVNQFAWFSDEHNSIIKEQTKKAKDGNS